MGPRDGPKAPSCEDLVEGHLDALHGLALAWTRDGDQARELVQRTFLKAFEKRDQLRSPGAARAWLITILRNERVSEFRQQARFDPLAEDPMDDASEEVGERFDPQFLQALPGALDILPVEQREIILLRFQQDLSYEAISESLGVPVGTVMSRLHRAKARLRRLLLALSPLSPGGAP